MQNQLFEYQAKVRVRKKIKPMTKAKPFRAYGHCSACSVFCSLCSIIDEYQNVYFGRI